MMTRLAFAFLFSLLLAGCSRKQVDPTPAPDPTPEATFSRGFANQSTSVFGGIIHPTASVTALAVSHAVGITFNIKSAPDELNLSIDRPNLTANWLGTYALKCRPRPSNPVSVSYLFNDTTGGTRIYLFSTNTWNTNLTGSLTITAYDATRQLVSGTFSVTAPDQLGPDETWLEQGRTTITVDGTFTNVKVRPQQ